MAVARIAIAKTDCAIDRGMGAVGTVRTIGQTHPLALTAVCTLVGYGIIMGTFIGLVPIYPTIGVETSTRLSHATALFNGATVLLLSIGWWSIRRGRIRRHKFAMTGAVASILLFLGAYLIRIGGGGTKVFVGPPLVRTAYLLMLAIHIVLSILAVPLVLYVFIQGIANPISRVGDTPHPRIGRIAVVTWILSLSLGLITYVLLEHVYAWTWTAAAVA